MEPIKDKLTIQEIASVTGLSAHTPRYYERIGLIHPIGCEENACPCYTPDDVGCIDFLTRLRATGMSIRELSEHLKLVHSRIEVYGQMIEERKLEKS